MKQMQDRALEAADVKLDFRSKLVAEEFNLSTRKSKPAESRRQMVATSSAGDESSSR